MSITAFANMNIAREALYLEFDNITTHAQSQRKGI